MADAAPVRPANDAGGDAAASSRMWEVEPFAVIDGGLSTALELLGHRPSGLLWTAQLVLDDPDVIIAAHRSFVDAGADVVITSSYQASVAGFEQAGADAASARAALASTTDLARRSGARAVAASIGPFGASLGDGSEYHGVYAADWATVRRFHRERLQILAGTGPDLFAIETIPGAVEAEIVLEELAAVTDAPAWVSYSCRDASTTCAGDPFTDAVALASRASQVVAVGLNCTDPRHVVALLDGARDSTALPFVVYPNHGREWDAAHECWIGDGDGHLGGRAPEWWRAGARLIGGCCGIGPEGVRSLVAARRALGASAQ